MLQEIEIEGPLPTYEDHALAYGEGGKTAVCELRTAVIERIKRSSILGREQLKKIPGKAYVGAIWIRSNLRQSQRSVSYAQGLIMAALKGANMIDPELSQLHEFYNLGFLHSAHRSRTIVLIADDPDELFDRWETMYA